MGSLLNSLTYGNDDRPSVLPRLLDENGQQTVNSGSGPNGQGIYQNLYDSNPYRNLHYNQSGWQKFLSGLGFRTSYDDFVEQAEINAAEYDAGIASMQFQNDYNSESAKVDRMRAAGLNPDLQGIGDASESASPTEDPNGMPSQDSSQQAQQAWGAFKAFGELVMASMTSGMSLYKEFIGLDLLKGQIEGVGLANEGQNIANNKAVASIIDSMILENISGLDQHSGSAVVDTIDRISTLASDDSRYDEYAGLLAGYGLSPRMIKNMRPRVAARAQSILTDENIFNEFAKRNEALGAMKKSQSSEYYSEAAWQDEVLDIHIRTLRAGQRKLSEITQRVAKKAQENSEVAADIQSAELNKLDQNDYGSLIGQQKLEQLLSDTYSTQFAKVLNGVKQDLVNELQASADAGNRMARTELYYMALHDFINFDFSVSLDAGWNKNGGLFGSFLPHFGVSGDAAIHLK